MLRLRNTLSGAIEEFRPLSPDGVGLYTCGPTVYDHAHIGNFRAYVWEDLLRRVLSRRGFRVRHVMNLTDVEDKIIRNSREAGLSLDDYTAPFIDGFFEDLDRLNILRAEVYPRATRHIEEMVSLVERLRERGHTYESQGSLYFRIDTFPAYGRLSGLDPAAIRPGVRVDSDDYDKEDVRDFVLWKGPREGETSWETRLGPGRPGWHLECSAMSMRYLGESFDLHTGGVDNIFPHHENEIAQSEGATGKPFVRTWLHCAHLMVDERKMSKSEGNFYTLRDLLERGCNPRAVRYLLLGAHYRKPLNFTLEGVRQAEAAVERLDAFRDRVDREPVPEGESEPLAERIRQGVGRMDEALDDDLNTAEALGAAFELLRDVHAAYDRGGEVLGANRTQLQGFVAALDQVFGLEPRGDSALEAEVQGLIDQRQRARESRDFAQSDAIRDRLRDMGIVLEDTPQGVRWRRR